MEEQKGWAPPKASNSQGSCRRKAKTPDGKIEKFIWCFYCLNPPFRQSSFSFHIPKQFSPFFLRVLHLSLVLLHLNLLPRARQVEGRMNTKSGRGFQSKAAEPGELKPLPSGRAGRTLRLEIRTIVGHGRERRELHKRSRWFCLLLIGAAVLWLQTNTAGWHSWAPQQTLYKQAADIPVTLWPEQSLKPFF